MSKPTPDSDIIQLSAAPASSIGSPSRRAHTAPSRAAAIALARSPWQRSRSERSRASTARSRAPTWSVTRPSTRSAQDGRVLVGADVDRATAGAQPGGDAGVAVDERAGLEQVVGEHGGGRLAVARLLDGRGHPAVQVEAPGAPEAGPDRLADQGVGHVEPAGAVLDEQPGGDGGVGGVEQVVAVEPAGVDEHRQRGRAAGDGGEVEDLHDTRIEAIEAQADHRPDRLRQLVADVALGVADQLGQEERVAAGGGVQLGGLGIVAAGAGAAARRRCRSRGRRRRGGSAGRRETSALATRSSSGVGSSDGTRTVASTITRPGSSWRSTCSIILSDGASAHCRSSRTMSIGWTADSLRSSSATVSNRR